MTKIAFTAPHFSATEAGMSVLESGGNAVDAMIAAAAAIAVAYPHMNSLGGDSFWLIQCPGKEPIAIDASGMAAQQASPAFYGESGIPDRGPRAALTMAGTVAGWQKAREVVRQRPGHCWLPQQPIPKLLQPAIDLAACGIEVTKSLAAASEKTLQDLSQYESFTSVFTCDGAALKAGDKLRNPALASLLTTLAEKGLMDFYCGQTAETIAEYLSSQGSPLTLQDFNQYQADVLAPVSIKTSKGTLYNFTAPTQGIASLLILAQYDKLYRRDWCEAERVHHLVECTKQAFMVRDRVVTDRQRLPDEWKTLRTDEAVEQSAAKINPHKALDWPHEAKPGDTVWMGAMDSNGVMVSFIQSIYWEFGSGVVIPDYGLVWNNRGISFSLDGRHPNVLAPGMKPFHTLNPAFAELNDGRRFTYGTMGGEGQPQTQAALFTRHIYENIPLKEAIALPRWLLGRTWGDVSHNLKLEKALATAIGHELSELGHEIAEVDNCNEMMGHAGGIIVNDNGDVQAATDPRSDGAALVKSITVETTDEQR